MIDRVKYFFLTTHEAIVEIHLQSVPRCLERAPICPLQEAVPCDATFMELLQHVKAGGSTKEEGLMTVILTVWL